MTEPASKRFNPPPNWPVPAGWSPPPSWDPPANWPPAPDGWRFWVDDVVPDPESNEPNPRRASATEAAVSALLLAPTLPAYLFVWDVEWSSPYAVWGLFAWLGVYFVVVAAIFARSEARRWQAAGCAIAAVLLDRGLRALPVFELTEWSLGLFLMAWVGSMTLFVAAWGLARRMRRSWLLGLIPSAVVSVVVATLWYLSDSPATPAGYWLRDVGTFAVGCLLCWAFDRLPGSTSRTSVAGSPPTDERPVRGFGQSVVDR